MLVSNAFFFKYVILFLFLILNLLDIPEELDDTQLYTLLFHQSALCNPLKPV